MDNQAKFLELSKYYEELKQKLGEVRTELDALMAELGVGSYLQDPETLVVYKIVSPKGQWVTYSAIGYERTALEGESRGSLSKKEAEEKGFDLKKWD